MNKFSRIITGSIVIVFSISLIFFAGILNNNGIDYASIIVGIFFLGIGIAILVNKKEDDIEEIKERGNK